MRSRALFAVLLLVAAPAAAEPVPGVCRFSIMTNHVLAPVDLPLPVPVNGVTAAVTIDPETGRFTFDGASVSIPPYPMAFSEANDIFVFTPATFTGTIDQNGSVVIPGVTFTICTLGTPAGTDCVPGNLCSDDVTTICSPGPGGGTGCSAGAVCQGVCRDDRSRTCAGDADCGPAGCGTGRLVPFTAQLTSDTSTHGDIVVTGSDVDFQTGTVTLVSVDNTPPGAPIVGDSGVAAQQITCTLDPIPVAASLPPPAAWEVKRGKVKLGKVGPVAGDDSLKLAGTFSPIGGVADFAADDLVLTLGTPENLVVSLRVPAGSLKANKKQTRLSLVDTAGTIVVRPPVPGGGTPTHKLKLKRNGSGQYKVTLASKGLSLDALGAPTVASAVEVGIQNATASDTTRITSRSIVF
jgi:hypothetical protein